MAAAAGACRRLSTDHRYGRAGRTLTVSSTRSRPLAGFLEVHGYTLSLSVCSSVSGCSSPSMSSLCTRPLAGFLGSIGYQLVLIGSAQHALHGLLAGFVDVLAALRRCGLTSLGRLPGS
eukprot:TRINITY_DN37099_c0_g1_i1.p2 TRINITY_DN37099_c0_g1~~TRINITY_DN37099_c0_g1_i1.p2  ORF type:complete len:119 (+),score=2.35 TRINITY_DN37099_c0_g1_i1:36-392(+)